MEESWGGKDYSNPNEPAVRSVDPVCGMTVNEEKAAGHAQYAGQTYYFCSVDCKTKFQDEPGKYIGQLRSL